MKPTRYDRIGSNYNQNRKADNRIVNSLDRLLNLPRGSTIADIGAGTGNHTIALANLVYNLKAMEKFSLPHDLTGVLALSLIYTQVRPTLVR